MREFLQKILATKAEEVTQLRRRRPACVRAQLPSCRGFAQAIASDSSLALVAEVKKASPSKGLISTDFRPVETAQTYEQGGAAAISVLTDASYFQGSIEYLTAVKSAVSLPVLRKDFIIDELQLEEAREAGADAVLLIVAALSTRRLIELSAYAKALGMDVLVEVHDVHELDGALQAQPSVLGINNRNLHTFAVDLNTTAQVLEHVPDSVVTIAESGIHTPEDAARMRRCGAKGILVGESLMRAGTPERVRDLMTHFRSAPIYSAAMEHGPCRC